MPSPRLVLLAAAVLALVSPAFGQAALLTPPVVQPLEVRQMFGVETHMRDGAVLVSDIYLPGSPGRHPVVLFRNPYQRNEDINDKDSLVKLARRFARAGIGFVHQDTRGRGDSGGKHDFMFGEGHDGYDTIEWIAAQPWSNGQIAMLGGSYRGTVQWLAARERPPHLTCLLSQAPGAEWFQTVPYNGGAFQMEWSLSYLNLVSGRLNNGVSASLTEWDKVYASRPLIDQDRLMGRELPDRREFLAHPTLDDWWKRLEFTTADFAGLDVPALHITGWFDSELPGAMVYWNGMQQHSPARDRQYFLIGPWVHAETRSGGSPTLGDLARGANSVVDIDSLSLRWFKSCFAGTTASFDLPRARTFLTGANVWRDAKAYPDPAARPRALFLHSDGDANADRGGGGGLSFHAPNGEPADHYVFDPRDVEKPGPPMRFQNARKPRSDILVYTTPPLRSPLAVLGPVDIQLSASTSALDTDFAAVLYDIDAAGHALPVVFKTAELRVRYRFGFDHQVPMVPGQAERLTLKLFDVGHVFLPGHRVRLEISSHGPGTNPNQNTGHDVATDIEWRSAQQTIYHDKAHPSAIILPVIPWP